MGVHFQDCKLHNYLWESTFKTANSEAQPQTADSKTRKWTYRTERSSLSIRSCTCDATPPFRAHHGKANA
eukprot:2373669-Rhodomonas_salina.4